ncbi:MAG: HlyD family efflux transporter periplasmic adaptor subunit [Candidatus Marinimicrobia bacterium]|nr:HlyD family efflux transporter periplasmic adaptor subunit [Candidatus Neomarinimicrobiota bacterium]
MDRELTTKQLLQRKFKTILRSMIIILIIIIGFFSLRSILTPSLEKSKIIIATAERSRIEDAISASGTVIPAFEQVITSPIKSTVVEVYHQAGEKVAAGSAILKLNKEFVHLELERLEDELKLHQNTKVQLNLALERNRTELQAQHDIKKLSLELLLSKLNQAEHLYEIGAGSKDHLDQARLNLEIARRELVLLEKTIENEEKTLRADIREIDLKIGIQEKSIEEIERQLELADIRADRDGVITWVNENIGATIQPGEIVARIADLTSYKVEGRISDIHISRLKLGAPVRVRINQRDLVGAITGIKPTIKSGTITFYIELAEKTDQDLRSNLRVDVFVITAYKDNIIRVKNGPFINGPGVQDIFIVVGDKAIRKTVRIGATNLDFVEIENEIEAGDRIIISDMEKYKHLDTIVIRN